MTTHRAACIGSYDPGFLVVLEKLGVFEDDALDHLGNVFAFIR